MDFHSTDIQHLQHLSLDVHLESDRRSEVTEGNLELLLPPFLIEELIHWIGKAKNK